jgi:hypothetical protein
MPICGPCRTPHDAGRCEGVRAGCFCQHMPYQQEQTAGPAPRQLDAEADVTSQPSDVGPPLVNA